MNLLAASLFLAMMPSIPDTPIDVECMIEAIAAVEGGEWGKPGGTCCLSYIAWEQHRPQYAYQLSGDRQYALPVYREHLHWLIYNIPRNRVKLTPASLYVCWHLGLQGGARLLHNHPMPDDGQRCQNFYNDIKHP